MICVYGVQAVHSATNHITTTGLCAYWKFNEGHGDIAEDYTGHGNDAHVHISPAVWPQGIEVTQKNKE